MLRGELLSVCQAYAESHENIFYCSKTVGMTFKAECKKHSHPITDKWMVKICQPLQISGRFISGVASPRILEGQNV